MKKLTFLMMLIVSLLVYSGSVVAQATVNPATAWFNSETFDTYTVTGWKNVSGNADATVVKIMPLSAASTTGSATGNVFASTSATGNFNNGSSAVNVYKNFTPLSGLLYVKTSFFLSMRANHYVFCDNEGNEVFRFGGVNNQSNNAFTCTDKPSAFTMGNRGNWADLEFIIDLSTNKILKMTGVYGTSTPEASNIDLSTTHNGNIATLKLLTETGYYVNGLDNTTIGEIIADAVKSTADIAGNANFQTLDGNTVDQVYSIATTADAMGLTLDVPAKDQLNIVWSISDYNGLSTSDVTLTRSTTDYASATLTTTDAVANDTQITIKASFGGVEKTFDITLKAASASALKGTLLTEISTATELNATIASGTNDYLDGVKSTLSGAINVAQGIYDDSSVTDPTDIQNAIDILQAAETAFTAALVPYNAFVTYIGTVQDIHDAETRMAAIFGAIKTTLQAAVNTASAANVTSTSDIDNETTTLGDALAAFNNAITAYEALETAIGTVQARYNIVSPRVGTAFLNYNSTDVNTLNNAITTADNKLATVTTITDLESAKTTVEDALIAFNAVNRVAPSTTKTYKIYSYGGSTLQTGSLTKKVLYDNNGTLAWEAASEYSGNNNEWIISGNDASGYRIENKTTGNYLVVSAVGVSATETNLTLSEKSVESGETLYSSNISADGTYFLYAIVSGANQLRLLDGGSFSAYGMNFNRGGAAYQFEENGDISTNINEISTSGTIVSQGYFDLTGKVTDAAAKGIIISKTTYSDGSVVIKKVINQ